MKRLSLLLIIFFFSILSQAQETQNWTLYPTKVESENNITKPSNDKVTLTSDSRIEQLVEKDLRIAEANPAINGFRIQIFYGSGPGSKTEARNIQSDYVKAFPDEKSYLIFQTPNFKIRVGDFRTRLEAEKHLRDLNELFPNAFIVKDKINLPEIKLEE